MRTSGRVSKTKRRRYSLRSIIWSGLGRRPENPQICRNDKSWSYSLKFSSLFFAATLLLSTSLCFAADITGTVTNKTTNKPSSGDEVVLVKLAAGMDEEARTKSDAKGNFTLAPKSADNTPHLIRVTHQGVNYFRPAPPGT